MSTKQLLSSSRMKLKIIWYPNRRKLQRNNTTLAHHGVSLKPQSQFHQSLPYIANTHLLPVGFTPGQVHSVNNPSTIAQLCFAMDCAGSANPNPLRNHFFNLAYLDCPIHFVIVCTNPVISDEEYLMFDSNFNDTSTSNQ